MGVRRTSSHRDELAELPFPHGFPTEDSFHPSAVEDDDRRANRKLDVAGIEPISDRVSPYSLRRTHASLRGALRDDPIYIAEQIGHFDPRFILSVHAKAAKRRERLPRTYPEAFDRALHWTEMGQSPISTTLVLTKPRTGDSPKRLDGGINSGSGRLAQ